MDLLSQWCKGDSQSLEHNRKDDLMAKHFKPDPYNGFKSDVERRRALNMKVVCQALVAVAFVLSGASGHFMGKLPWLKTLLP